MSYPINYPTPQGANVQIFKDGGTTSDWVKPQGASFIWVTLIGAGGGGGYNGAGSNGTGGGGSGAVTNYMGPAFLIPDVLRVSIGKGGGPSGTNGAASSVIYQQKNGTGYTLLTANGGISGDQSTTGGVGGAADVSNYFSCMGFFQSVAGQAGSDGTGTSSGVNQTASTTTFLSGGAGGAGGAAGTGGGVTANYGYSMPPTTAGGTVIGAGGFFQMQPIIVGGGGAGGTTNSGAQNTSGGKGGIGCGGGGSGENELLGGLGGDGMVVIITW